MKNKFFKIKIGGSSFIIENENLKKISRSDHRDSIEENE
jgi:hypothetical protein